MAVHNIARSGFGLGNDLYDNARPSYQSAALSYIRDEMKSPSPFNIVELGAGTGIFTKALLAHPQWQNSVRQIYASEPSQGMRDVFSKTIKDDRVSISEGTFASTGAERGTADLAVIAQAFHWCPDFEQACKEFSRILKPGGKLCFIWNLEDRESAKWVAEVRDCIEAHEAGSPQFRLGLWRQFFDVPSFKEHFLPQKEKNWSYALPATLDVVWNRASSKSYIAVLPEEVKVEVKGKIKEIVNRGDDKVWIDEKEGIFEYPYKTYVVIMEKQ